MKIAIFHNYYAKPGGEDVMFELECKALREAGHEVVPYAVRNAELLEDASPLKKLRIAWQAAGNPASRRRIREFLKVYQPDVAHVHNWFPVLSPSIYDAHQDAGIPVVQTLHNYRLGCAAGNYRRDGRACEDCQPLQSLAAVRHRCYRGSLAGSLAWKRMVDLNWRNGTFSGKVSCYIAPSSIVAQRHVKMGLPPEMIKIVPNACEDPWKFPTTAQKGDRSEVVFLGRLVPEKGAETLLRAWEQMARCSGTGSRNLLIIGEGPEESRLREACSNLPDVRFRGQLPRAEVQSILSKAALLVFPSNWQEPFGLGIIEAMAAGCPVIASDLGAPCELVTQGKDGLLFPAGDPVALGNILCQLLSDPRRLSEMGQAARKTYETRFTPSAHTKNLLQIFASLAKKTSATV